jgi:hypothetical protein
MPESLDKHLINKRIYFDLYELFQLRCETNEKMIIILYFKYLH